MNLDWTNLLVSYNTDPTEMDPGKNMSNGHLDSRSLHYSTIFAQCSSSCGKYLAAATNYGRIYVFNVQAILNPDVITNEINNRYPMFSFEAHAGTIYSLTSTKDYLISGSLSEICAWSWNDIISKAITKCSWKLIVPEKNSEIIKPEVNCLFSKKMEDGNGNGNVLYAGCSDSNIYAWDIETCKLQTVLSGHTDFIHQIVSTSNGNELITCSEDGSIKIWDMKNSNSESSTFEPYKISKLNRPKFGKWIGCISLDYNEDWLICGGGPELSLWHMRTKTMTKSFSSNPEFAAHQAFFQDDAVIAAGNQPFIYQWYLNGEEKAQIPSHSSTIYSLNLSNDLNKPILTAGGTSHKLDVCTNMLYKDFSLILK